MVEALENKYNDRMKTALFVLTLSLGIVAGALAAPGVLHAQQGLGENCGGDVTSLSCGPYLSCTGDIGNIGTCVPSGVGSSCGGDATSLYCGPYLYCDGNIADIGTCRLPVTFGFSPALIPFGQVEIGQVRQLPITFYNNSGKFYSGDIKVFTFAGPAGQAVENNAFRCVGTCNVALQNGQSVQIQLEFAPQRQGFTAGQVKMGNATAILSGSTPLPVQQQSGESAGGSVATGGGFIQISNPLGDKKFSDILVIVLNFIFTIALAIAPFMIIYAGFLFVTGGGNPEQISRGRTVLIWTFVGIIVMLLSRGLIAVLQGILGV